MAFGSEACRTGSACDPSMTGRCSSCAARVSGERLVGSLGLENGRGEELARGVESRDDNARDETGRNWTGRAVDSELLVNRPA